MSASGRRLGSKGKGNRAPTPLSLEQLEARTLCTVNSLFESLHLLGSAASHVSPKTAVAAQVNAKPAFATPIVVVGGTQVSGKEVRLQALGKDDKGESNLLYSWKVTQAPSGGSATFSVNDSNRAKATTLVFSKPGVYGIKVTLTDKGGLSTSSTQRITVKQSGGSLSITTADNKAVTSGSTVNAAGKTLQLKVQLLDQFGSPSATQQKITWAVTAAPAGGTAAVSTSGSLATIAFSKAGLYKLKATSASGSSVNFSVNVAQTVSRINVTPGTASLAAGSTKQFTAQAFDQFGAPIASNPSIVWSASAGTISTSGLFNAPAAAGSVTITAKSGSVAGTAAATVASQSNLQNSSLAGLVSTLYADGSLSRLDVMKILRSAGVDGVVDGTELSDLRYVVANAPTYKIDSYVQVLANNVVNSNPANLLYQGIAAGNLAAGSTASLLTILVDKWFMGTDVPMLTSSSLSYRNAAGVLFSGTPSRKDEFQGMLGDCYFISALGAIADRNPTAISNMFIDNGDGTYTVRFYTGQYGAFYNSDGTISDGFKSGSGTADYVTVNRMLPSQSNGTFAYANYGKQLGSTTTPLWIALAEKAYAQWNATGKANRNGINSYAAIEGGWMAAVDAQVLGKNATDYYLASANKQSLIGALTSNRAVTIGTNSSPNAGGLVGSHAYSVTGYDSTTDTFNLYNPWGTSQPSPLTWAALQANCSMFVVADATVSTAIPKFAVSAAPTVKSSLASDALHSDALHSDAPLAPRIEPSLISESLAIFAIPDQWSSSMFDDIEFGSADWQSMDWQAEQTGTDDCLSESEPRDDLQAENWQAIAFESSADPAGESSFRNLTPEMVDEVIDDIDALLREALA